MCLGVLCMARSVCEVLNDAVGLRSVFVIFSPPSPLLSSILSGRGGGNVCVSTVAKAMVTLCAGALAAHARADDVARVHTTTTLRALRAILGVQEVECVWP